MAISEGEGQQDQIAFEETELRELSKEILFSVDITPCPLSRVLAPTGHGHESSQRL